MHHAYIFLWYESCVMFLWRNDIFKSVSLVSLCQGHIAHNLFLQALSIPPLPLSFTLHSSTPLIPPARSSSHAARPPLHHHSSCSHLCPPDPLRPVSSVCSPPHPVSTTSSVAVQSSHWQLIKPFHCLVIKTLLLIKWPSLPLWCDFPTNILLLLLRSTQTFFKEFLLCCFFKLFIPPYLCLFFIFSPVFILNNLLSSSVNQPQPEGSNWSFSLSRRLMFVKRWHPESSLWGSSSLRGKLSSLKCVRNIFN